MVYCPICLTEFTCSEYLKEQFPDIKTLWLANMVTHYRHIHISFWNKCWGPHGEHYRGKWFGTYEEEKKKVNERCKRQIIRQCKDFMNFHQIGLQELLKLQFTDNKTIDLANKYLHSGRTYLNDYSDTPLFSNSPV